MFFTLMASAILVVLYAVYWVGATCFSAPAYAFAGRSRAFLLIGSGLLALVPALFILHFSVQLSAHYHHLVPAWGGWLFIAVFLVAPWMERINPIARKFGQHSASVTQSHTVEAAPFSDKMLAVICVLAALYCTTYIQLFSHSMRAEGYIKYRVPYYSSAGKIGTHRVRVELRFTDHKGVKHGFYDTSEYIPQAAGSPIGVLYNPLDPKDDPLPDLSGWERVGDLQILLIIFFLLRVGYMGFKSQIIELSNKAPALEHTVTIPPQSAAPVKKQEHSSKPKRRHLENMIGAVKPRLVQALRNMGHECKNVFHAGAIEIAPHHLFFGIYAVTDAGRDRINADPEAQEILHRLLLAEGYPDKAVPLIGLRAESQETVDRDWGGDWYQAWR